MNNSLYVNINHISTHYERDKNVHKNILWPLQFTRCPYSLLITYCVVRIFICICPYWHSATFGMIAQKPYLRHLALNACFAGWRQTEYHSLRAQHTHCSDRFTASCLLSVHVVAYALTSYCSTMLFKVFIFCSSIWPGFPCRDCNYTISVC